MPAYSKQLPGHTHPGSAKGGGVDRTTSVCVCDLRARLSRAKRQLNKVHHVCSLVFLHSGDNHLMLSARPGGGSLNGRCVCVCVLCHLEHPMRMCACVTGGVPAPMWQLLPHTLPHPHTDCSAASTKCMSFWYCAMPCDHWLV